MEKWQGNMAYNTSVSARPVVASAWRGRFSIPSQNINNINVTAHVLNGECLKVLEAVSIMSDSLCLEMIPRIHAWPSSFKSSPPTEHNIAIIFFSHGRDGEVLDSVLNYAISMDIALKATIGGSELVIFTSNQLPPKLHRIHGKPYLWGVFREHEFAASHQSDHHVQIPNKTGQMSSSSSNKTSLEERGRPVFSSERNPCVSVKSAHAAKADKRGRNLDGAWEHARPLDALRQKAECRHCGFFSSRGGISRLKAHLGGGDPRIRLPGCPGVPPEVKKVMAEWFVRWLKTTKALWTKEIRETEVHVDTKGRPQGVAWEYGKASDAEENQKTDFKYIDFTSLHSDTLQYKVKFGEDSKLDVEARPKASPEIGVVSIQVNNSRTFSSTGAEETESELMKRSTAKLKKPRDSLQAERRGRPLDDAWNHAKALDEARQKTQCNYCGFRSLYGGISRLKAHLGGGSPQIQLQGCPQVPAEVKRLMEQWFNEWAKYSSASWVRKSPGVHAKPHKKKWLPDDTWQHAISLDEKEQALKCKYCGFVSQSGGFARLIVHLGGGDPKMQLEGCRNVSLELQSFMAQKIKKYKKKSKAEHGDRSKEF